jgi:hypothetical protein
MIDNSLDISGQKEVINTLNSYIKDFIQNLIFKIDTNIDNIQLKKIEELITYLEKLKQSSDVKLKNIVDKKMISMVEKLSSMILSGNLTESSLNNYIEESIYDVNNQASEIMNKINSDLSIKIDEFSKEFEGLSVDSINLSHIINEDKNEENSLLVEQMKSKIKEVITDKKVTEEASKQILTLAKQFLPKDIMKGKGPAWIGKASGKVAIGISVLVEVYNIHSAIKEHNEMIEKQRQIVLNAKNDAQKIVNDIKTTLYVGLDEIIDEIFNSLIINFKHESSKINGNNYEFLDLKSKFISILNKL